MPFLLRRASHCERFVTPGPTREISQYSQLDTPNMYTDTRMHTHMHNLYAAYLEEVGVLPSDTRGNSYDTLLKM